MRVLLRQVQTELKPSAVAQHSELDHAQKISWPEGFSDFLACIGEPIETVHLALSNADESYDVPHGQTGAKVVWTVGEPLPECWKVAAYHSDALAEMRNFSPEHLEKADGIVVQGESFSAPLAINTADCLAVAATMEWEETIELASCFHAGWRGYTSGIQQNFLSLLQREMRQNPVFETNKNKPHFWFTISPAIQGKSYPCGDDVLQALRAHHNRFLRTADGWTEVHERAFASAAGLAEFDRTGKIFPDLQALLCLELHAYGFPLSQVSVFREDTRHSSWWPSHRRSVAGEFNRARRFVTHLCPPACRQVQNRVSKS
jgi:copper oxidase (laccase) domain-containing protein